MTTTKERTGERGTPAPKARTPRSQPKSAAATRTVAPTGRSTGQAGTRAPDHTSPHWPAAHALVAAERAVRRDALHVRLPIIGELQLPAAEEVAFIGGVAVLATIGIIEWPVAVLLGVGHGLALNRRNKVVRAFGEALEEA